MTQHGSTSGGMYSASYIPSAQRRDGGPFSDEVYTQGKEGYRQDMHGLGQDQVRDYRLLPTKEGYEHGDHAHHHIRGQTMKQRMQSRSMTDTACGCVFFMFWCGMVAITSNGIAHGDPRRLYHGFDYQGRLCGVNDSVVDKPLLYWPDTDHMELSLCVAVCPGKTPQSMSVPRETVVTTDGRDYVRTEIMRQDATLMTYPTKEVGNRWCLPVKNSQELANVSRSIVDEEQYSGMGVLIDSFKDICDAWLVLLFMLPVSMTVGYGYIVLLRYCAKTVLNVVLAALIVGSGGLSFYCLYYVRHDESDAQDVLGKYTDKNKDIVWFIGAFSTLVCFLLVCAGCAMHSKMEKVSAVVEAAGDAMWNVSLLLCMPVLEVIIKMVYTVIWLCFASFVISDGDIAGSFIDVGGHEIHGLVRTFRYSMSQRAMILFYCVGFLWGLEFISMLFKFIVSYAVAIWYFQPCRADMSKTEVAPEVWRDGFVFALFYHMGSLCIGAAVVILLYIFIPLQVIVQVLVGQTQRNPNPCAKAVLYSCTCCIKCTQEIVSYVNKGAVIEMVLRGDHDFFTSAGSSMRVMRDAELSVISLHGVTMIFQIVGIVISAGIGGFLTYWFTGTVSIYVDRQSKYFLENRLGVCVIAAVLAMTVSTVFMWTLDLVSDSLLFCWLVEGEDDKFHLTYAPKLLRNVVRFDDYSMDNRMMKDGLHLDRPYSYEGQPHDRVNSYDSPGKTADKGMTGSGGGGGWSSTSHLTSSPGRGRH